MGAASERACWREGGGPAYFLDFLTSRRATRKRAKPPKQRRAPDARGPRTARCSLAHAAGGPHTHTVATVLRVGLVGARDRALCAARCPVAPLAAGALAAGALGARHATPDARRTFAWLRGARCLPVTVPAWRDREVMLSPFLASGELAFSRPVQRATCCERMRPGGARCRPRRAHAPSTRACCTRCTLARTTCRTRPVQPQREPAARQGRRKHGILASRPRHPRESAEISLGLHTTAKATRATSDWSAARLENFSSHPAPPGSTGDGSVPPD